MKYVYLKRCEDYSYEIISASFSKMLGDMGGIEKYIKPNSRVLIKPNLVMKKKPEDAVTTHPMVLRVLCDELLKINCKVIIADSPGGTYNKSSLRAIYKICGLEELEYDENIELNYDTNEFKMHNENGVLIKSLDVIKPIQSVDHIISVCKLKTHSMATFTGGVKNLFGVIPGLLKAEYHFKMPEIKSFSNLLVDICQFIKPTLTIMDAVVGMEGYGPTAGSPRKINALLASESPYAIDVVACNIINLNPNDVPTIERSVERNFLKKDFSDIIIKGDYIKDFFIKDYKIPKLKSLNFLDGRVPLCIQKRIDYIFKPKPIFLHDICIGCMECKKVCPAHVIEMKENKPIVNLDNCIRCFCCHELCPKKAVHIKKPIFFKLFR